MKNKMTKRVFLTSMVAGAVAMGSMAYAGPNCKQGGKHGSKSGMDKSEFMQKRFERMSTKLGLSDTQKTQVQALMQNHRNVMKPLRDEKRAIRTEMMNLDPAAADYDAKVEDIANRESAIVRQITIARANKRKQMAGILTPEQQAAKKAMHANRKSQHGYKRKNAE
jgi:Spy/CpxP family protein refolding chaperone